MMKKKKKGAGNKQAAHIIKTPKKLLSPFYTSLSAENKMMQERKRRE